MENETTGKAGKEQEGWLQWQRHPRRPVSDESVRPLVRSDAAFGLALAPRFSRLREHDPLSPPAIRPRPPPFSLPLGPQLQGGSVRALVFSPQSYRPSLHFLTAPHLFPQTGARLVISPPPSLAACLPPDSSTAAPSAFYLPGIPHKAFKKRVFSTHTYRICTYKLFSFS